METKEAMAKLNELMNQVDNCYMRIARHYGLSYNQLMLLYMLDGDDPITQKQVCDTLYLPKSSVHSLLNQLMEKGYVSLTDGSNKKEKFIVFTDRGHQLMELINQDTREIEDTSLVSIPARETERFIKTADKLAKKMTDETEKLYGKKD